MVLLLKVALLAVVLWSSGHGVGAVSRHPTSLPSSAKGQGGDRGGSLADEDNEGGQGRLVRSTGSPDNKFGASSMQHPSAVAAGNNAVGSRSQVIARYLSTTVSTESALTDALANDVTIKFAANIVLTSSIEINGLTGLVIDGSGFKVDGQESLRCFYIHGNAEVGLKNLTITNGYDAYGAGLFIDGGTVSIMGCTVSSNNALDDGGGFRINIGTVTMTGCTISLNTASSYGTPSTGGGGFYLYGGSVSMTGCTVSLNTADLGGGIKITGGTISMTGCTISSNSASSGAGLYIGNGDVTCTDGTINDNVASEKPSDVPPPSGPDSSLGGGAINNVGLGTFNAYGTTVMTNNLQGGEANDVGGYGAKCSFCASSCPAGEYGTCSSAIGAPSCSTECICAKCPPGTSLAASGSTSSSDCELCSAGTMSAVGAVTCAACMAGNYASTNKSDTSGGLVTQALVGATFCNSCPAGYRSAGAAVVCLACSAGTSSDASASSCFPCAEGQFSEGGSACVECAAGMVAFKLGSRTCTDCGAGKFSLSTAACGECPAGKAQGFPGQSLCVECAAGSVAATKGSVTCTACGSGKFSTNTKACADCPAGKAQGFTGQDFCVDCIAGTSNALVGQATCSDCPGDSTSLVGAIACRLCNKIFYASLDGICEPCVEGMLCDTDGLATQTNLQLEEGFWRISQSSTRVYPCPLPYACMGSNTMVTSSRYISTNYRFNLTSMAQRRRLAEDDGDAFGDGYCNQGFQGPMCAVCSAEFYFDADMATCTACTNAPLVIWNPTMTIFLVSFALAISAVVAIKFYKWASPPQKNANMAEKLDECKEKALNAMEMKGVAAEDVESVMDSIGDVSLFFKKRAIENKTEELVTVLDIPGAIVTMVTTASITVTTAAQIRTRIRPSSAFTRAVARLAKIRVRLKALTTFMQISVYISFNCSVAFPMNFTEILKALKVVNLDIITNISLSCRFPNYDYLAKVVISTVGPLAAAVLLIFVYYLLKLKESLFHEVTTEDKALAASGVLKPIQVTNLRHTFEHYDVNCVGALNKSEMKNVVREFSPSASDDEVAGLVARIFDGAAGESSSITFEEMTGIFTCIFKCRTVERVDSLADLVERAVKVSESRLGETVAYMLLLLTYLVFVSTSTIILHYFACEDFFIPENDGGGTQKYLRVDFSVDCRSARYSAFSIYVCLMVLVYPVGIPVFYGVLIWRKRQVARSLSAMEHEVGYLKFLLEGYSPSYYYFEVVECLRRLLMSSVLGLIPSTTAASPAVGIVISIFFTNVFLRFMPLKSLEDNQLAVALSNSLTLLFLAALLIKLDATGDSANDQELLGIFLIVVLFAGPIMIVLQLASGYIWVCILSVFFGMNTAETLADADGDDGSIDVGSSEGFDTSNNTLVAEEEKEVSWQESREGSSSNVSGVNNEDRAEYGDLTFSLDAALAAESAKLEAFVAAQCADSADANTSDVDPAKALFMKLLNFGVETLRDLGDRELVNDERIDEEMGLTPHEAKTIKVTIKALKARDQPATKVPTEPMAAAPYALTSSHVVPKYSRVKDEDNPKFGELTFQPEPLDNADIVDGGSIGSIDTGPSRSFDPLLFSNITSVAEEEREVSWQENKQESHGSSFGNASNEKDEDRAEFDDLTSQAEPSAHPFFELGGVEMSDFERKEISKNPASYATDGLRDSVEMI